MGILAELAGDLPTADFEVVARQRGSKADEPTGETHLMAYMDMPGREQAERGITTSTRILKTFCDLVGGEVPFTMKTRLRGDGADWNLVSLQRIPDPDAAGVIAVLEATL